MNKKIIFIISALSVLVVGNVFFSAKYYFAQKELLDTKRAFEHGENIKNVNEKVLDFAKFFIEKVLQVETEVDFETRLKLENSVRDLDDAEVLSQWNKFIESQTEEQAQDEVKNLLKVLLDKMRV